jgi:hypothetical protein
MKDYKYHSSLTVKYKKGFIHSAYYGNKEVIKVQIDNLACLVEVKSYHAAKILITKYEVKND